MKKAFTLAEVLITLGIVGTVAALTIPALVKHSGAAEVGPKLAKFANTFENGISNLLQARHKSKISDLTTDSATFMGLLSSQIIMTPAPEGSSYRTYLLESLPTGGRIPRDGETPTSNSGDTFSTNNGYSLYILKDGSNVYYKSNDTVGNPRGPYKGIVGELVYDINGDNGNNIIGKEVFKFLVDNSGELIPYGSNADTFLNNDVSRPECSFSAPSLTDEEIATARRNCRIISQLPRCLATATRNKTKSAGYACTGKIADNGYKSD